MEWILPQSLPKALLINFDFELLASRTVREYIPVVLSRPICGTSPRQPQETNTKSTATATPFL